MSNGGRGIPFFSGPRWWGLPCSRGYFLTQGVQRPKIANIGWRGKLAIAVSPRRAQSCVWFSLEASRGSMKGTTSLDPCSLFRQPDLCWRLRCACVLKDVFRDEKAKFMNKGRKLYVATVLALVLLVAFGAT